MRVLRGGLAVVLPALLCVTLHAHPDPQVGAVDRYLNGRRFLMCPNGGAICG